MNAVNRLKAKLAGNARDVHEQQQWLQYYLRALVVWAAILAPVVLLTWPSHAGAGVTLFFAGSGVLVWLCQYWVERERSKTD